MININGTYFQNPTFPSTTNDELLDTKILNEQFNFAKIIMINLGRKITLYLKSKNDYKVVNGITESVGIDYVLISDPTNGKWSLIKLKEISYVEFDEKINYN